MSEGNSTVDGSQNPANHQGWSLSQNFGRALIIPGGAGFLNHQQYDWGILAALKVGKTHCRNVRKIGCWWLNRTKPSEIHLRKSVKFDRSFPLGIEVKTIKKSLKQKTPSGKPWFLLPQIFEVRMFSENSNGWSWYSSPLEVVPKK